METLFYHQFNNYQTTFFIDNNSLSGTQHILPKKHLVFNATHGTTKEEDYVQNYGNPLTRVNHSYVKIIVKKKEEKVSLQIFYSSRLRREGQLYFRIDKNCDFLTVDTETGDVYQGRLLGYQKKRKVKKTFQRNNFKSLSIVQLFNRIRDNISENNIEAQKIFYDAYKIFTTELKMESPEVELKHYLLKQYLDKKKVKYPNNFHLFYKVGHLILKDIRKNGNNIVDTFMKEYGLKGEKVKKALHECENINYSMLKQVIDLFGYEWVAQDYEFLLGSLNNQYHPTHYSFLDMIPSLQSFSNVEKRRIFDFMKFNIILGGTINYSTFIDHIVMINELRGLGEIGVKWTAENISTFNREHADLSTMLEYHRKGKYLRVYPEQFKDELEVPFEVDGETYYPILLDETENYVEESSTQSNCVKSYIGNPSSYIVSLRKNDKSSTVRATLEFFIERKSKNKVTFRIKQALTRFNQKLEDVWDIPIIVLERRFSELLDSQDFVPVRIEKKFQNGKKLTSDTLWDDNGILKWSSVDITSYYD